MPTNDFLPFCPTDTGTNLLTQSQYVSATDRTDGNQPGIASAKLVNKALRQASYIASQMAQFLSNKTAEDVLDDANPAKLLAQFTASLKLHAPIVNTYTSGSSTWNQTVMFQIATGSATSGATYTNNGVTFTVVTTAASGTQLRTTGGGYPSVGTGTLTKTSGTGDATITFYAFQTALYIVVKAQGGGGGGDSSGTATTNVGGNGGHTTFGSTIVDAGGGSGGQNWNFPGGGGGVSFSGVTSGYRSVTGGTGDMGANGGAFTPGGGGGESVFGGRGGYNIAVATAQAGQNAATNSGAGGGGATGPSAGLGGSGGGAGGYGEALISGSQLTTIAGTATVVVGAGGGGGGAASGGQNGGNGGSGRAEVWEYFQ